MCAQAVVDLDCTGTGCPYEAVEFIRRVQNADKRRGGGRPGSMFPVGP
jgi:hypothetical protein